MRMAWQRMAAAGCVVAPPARLLACMQQQQRMLCKPCVRGWPRQESVLLSACAGCAALNGLPRVPGGFWPCIVHACVQLTCTRASEGKRCMCMRGCWSRELCAVVCAAACIAACIAAHAACMHPGIKWHQARCLRNFGPEDACWWWCLVVAHGLAAGWRCCHFGALRCGGGGGRMLCCGGERGAARAAIAPPCSSG